MQNCLKEIKLVRTKHMDNLKMLKKDLEFYKSDKKLASDKKRDLAMKKASIEKTEKKVREKTY